MLPQLIPFFPVDPYLPYQSYRLEVTTALTYVLQAWNLDTSHPLLHNCCERQLDALDGLAPISPKDEDYPNRHYIVDFLANVCTSAQSKRLLPHLAIDNQRSTPRHQRSFSLKNYLARILTAEDLPELEQLIRPQNRLKSQILDGVCKAKLPGTAELIQRLLERHDWTGLRRRHLKGVLKRLPSL